MSRTSTTLSRKIWFSTFGEYMIKEKMFPSFANLKEKWDEGFGSLIYALKRIEINNYNFQVSLNEYLCWYVLKFSILLFNFPISIINAGLFFIKICLDQEKTDLKLGGTNKTEIKQFFFINCIWIIKKIRAR